VCRAGHPLTRLAKVGIEDLERYRLVGPHLARRFGLSFSPRSALGEMSEDSKYFVPAIVCASWPAIREIVARSDAIAFRARAVLTLPENRGSLSVLSFEAPWFMTELAIMWRRDRMQHPALKAFRDIARRNEALLMGEGRDRLHAVA
jgi:DNA-binding transcriptional LysR family regulator